MNSYRPFRLFCYASFLLIMVSAVPGASANAPARDYYQLKIYHYKSQAQENRIDAYLQKAYLPALHRAGIIRVGVFKPVDQPDTDRRIYVFTPFPSLDKLDSMDQQLRADGKYMSDSKDYADASYEDAPYSRIEIIVLQAFPGMPSPAVPLLSTAKGDRIYELRSYESATEKYNVSKVDMFNNGDEIGLFKRLGFNAVFYAEVIVGSHMPNLMYMTTFNSKEEREKHWEAFFNDPQWKALTAKSVYKNNVSHADIVFLHPAEYSDF